MVARFRLPPGIEPADLDRCAVGLGEVAAVDHVVGMVDLQGGDRDVVGAEATETAEAFELDRGAVGLREIAVVDDVAGGVVLLGADGDVVRPAQATEAAEALELDRRAVGLWKSPWLITFEALLDCSAATAMLPPDVGRIMVLSLRGLVEVGNGTWRAGRSGFGVDRVVPIG